MRINRRDFLKTIGAGSATLAAPGALFAADPSSADSDIIVSIFLRGAADGLSLVVPHGDDDYYAARGELAIAKPGELDGALYLDQLFGLHPGMQALLPILQNNDLAIVHAVGSPHDSHSHFEAQDLMERGIMQSHASPHGWLGRLFNQLGNGGVFQSIGFGNSAQTALRAEIPALAMSSINNFDLQLPDVFKQDFTNNLSDLFDRNLHLDNVAQGTLSAIKALNTLDPSQYPVENNAVYPATSYATQLKEIGQLIKADIGLQAACVDIGGWDTHQGQNDTLSALIPAFADSLAAFYTDMGTRMVRIHVVVQTEFGRRVASNASGGTDHGHGSVMFLMSGGGSVNGGQVYHRWPTLAPEALVGPGDLDVTIDYRNILYELIDRRFGGMPMEDTFPGFNNYQPEGLYG